MIVKFSQVALLSLNVYVVADPGFPTPGGPPTYDLASFLPKTARKQVAFQSNANHPLAESMGYIKFEGM